MSKEIIKVKRDQKSRSGAAISAYPIPKELVNWSRIHGNKTGKKFYVIVREALTMYREHHTRLADVS